MRPADGPWTWRRWKPSDKGSSASRLPVKRSARPWPGWVFAGCARSSGSPVLLRRTPEKRQRDRLIRWAATHPDWLLGFADETGWSRLARPALHAWSDEDQPVRLVEQAVARDDPDQRALACYGLLRPETDAVWLRFLDGRPISAVTTVFREWCGAEVARRGKTALLLVWDNASWQGRQAVRTWVRGSGSSSARCRARAPGSTRSNPRGGIPNAGWLSRTGCCRPANWPSGSVPP